ncbi:uncharacterized protein LOC116112241 [Pistacia vera]|uniref:uncharacterized protein LOC116112241 n=1 Tax=Pistacia vera TaxID=55513 RepID=UPI001262ED27|nr:uncharacterized protein LOC116112241 [Pistacia vera]
MAASKINLKLLIDTENNKVLFAEAGKEFVDFLFYLLSLPVGTFVKLLGKNRIGGSLDHHTYVTDVKNFICPTCKLSMSKEIHYVSPDMEITADAAGEGGFVKGVVDYMVMDDLEVMPMSTISGITLLNKFNVKDVDALAERVVEFGMDEGVKLLKASLECNSVFTSVFNGNKGRK